MPLIEGGASRRSERVGERYGRWHCHEIALFLFCRIACKNVHPRHPRGVFIYHGRLGMAKGMQQKKATKKKPAKTMMEKRAEKSAKKGR